MAREILMAFVDYENLRMGFRDYVEYITIEDVIRAFEELAGELGDLRGIFFYGDWTRRAQDARAIEERGHRAVNVLSTRSGKDRSDQPMAFAMDDVARENREVTAFIVGSGDADFKEAIIRCRQKGKRIYVLCFGASAARELFTLTKGVYPLEGQLNLMQKAPIQAAMPGIAAATVVNEWEALIQRLDSLEKTLPHVVRRYFRDKILLPARQLGDTGLEIDRKLSKALEDGILEEYEIPNPKLPGRMVAAIRLRRESPLVQDVLKPKRDETG